MAAGEQVLTAVLAEYGALRAEMDRRSDAQNTLLNLSLTLSGALVAYGVKNGLLLVVLLQPLLACGLGLLWADHGYTKAWLASYIESRLEPEIATAAGAPDAARWQRYDSTRAEKWRTVWLLPPVAAFVATSALTLALSFGVWRGDPGGGGLLPTPSWVVRVLWAAGVVAVGWTGYVFWRAFGDDDWSTFDRVAGRAPAQPPGR